MKLILQIFILCIGFSSCTINPYILLKRDGTAQVQTTFDVDSTHIKKLKKSAVISNIDTVNYQTSFTVSNIDSIGNFIPFYKPDFIQFKNFGDSMRISTSHNEPFDTLTPFCCHLTLVIRSQTPFEAYRNNGKRIKKEKSKKYHEVLLGQTRSGQLKGKNNIDVMLKWQ